MMKIILVILLIWAIWLGYQYFNKSETVNVLIKQKMEEFYATDVNILLQESRKGYEYKTVEMDGKKFWMSWVFNIKGTNTIEMNGRVDFIEVLPFSDIKLGSPFKFVLKTE